MKIKIAFVLISIVLFSCGAENGEQASKVEPKPIVGTWKLLKGTLIEHGDTTVTDYTKAVSFIKIINDSHFAFLQHDLNKGKDSAAVFVAGGGRYTIQDSSYTEHLEYCSAREWEGNDFAFTVSIHNDTLTQYGVEKVESAGVNRINIEKYVRVKNNEHLK
ncbi:lipocalin-like domain-containing protein [Chitinophagaceae bacterium LB-8]|uniref:Lipocalin-like domain-containing protein n=1 Tax=Paraflavisolibacter caeni TaxID=2982496 RepID=A0A9X3BGC4_9BACT|nr:lipocalin-like domain-containing protein [Paraflavisolibacter caeni]MCU7547553.1 lipocalin-like domain-containing protein [Paraflavisolibacter caeni]